jgi:hypothetical protein
VRLVLALALVGCGGSTPAAPPPPPVANKVVPTPPPPPIDDPKCAGNLTPHRETMREGQLTELAAFGKQGIYAGASHSHFADGGYEMTLMLEIFGEKWLPDSRDRGYHAIGDHCVRIVKVTGNELELDIAIQPAHAYDDGRCHMGCCTTEAQQKLGPGGEQECCFCPDNP